MSSVGPDLKNNNYSTMLLSKSKDVADDILEFCADNGFELIEDDGIDLEVVMDAEGNYIDFRIYDPNDSVFRGYKYTDGWSKWMLGNYESRN